MMNIWKNREWVPMLLSEQPKPFDSEDYIFEVKFDGIRAVIFVSPEKVVVQTRNKQDISYLFPELQEIKKLVKEDTIFDGEIVSFQDGVPSFSKLQERNHLKNETKIKEMSKDNPVIFVCFDVLYASKDLTNLNLLERKNILKKYKDNEVFIKDKYIDTDGKELFKSIKQIGLEGIIAKKKDSVYEINTRTDNWIKIKNLKHETFYIGGYLEQENSNVISLFLGEYKNNKLYFVGKVSMGKKRSLYKKIKSLKINKNSSFVDYSNECNYITPKFKCKIDYLERTKSNHLRQPIFKEEIK